MISFYTKETFYMKMEKKYCIMGSINQNKQRKETNTLHSTYQIIKDPHNGKYQNNISRHGETTNHTKLIHENSSKRIYSSIYLII